MTLKEKRQKENTICDEIDNLNRMLTQKYNNTRFKDELENKKYKLLLQLIKLGLQKTDELNQAEYLKQEIDLLEQEEKDTHKRYIQKKKELKQLTRNIDNMKFADITAGV